MGLPLPLESCTYTHCTARKHTMKNCWEIFLEKGPQKAEQWLLPDLKGWDRANEGSRNISTIAIVQRKEYFVPQMLGSQSSSHSQPGAGPREPLAHLSPGLWYLPGDRNGLWMVPWVGPAWQGPWLSKEGLWGAGHQHCCGVAGQRLTASVGWWVILDPRQGRGSGGRPPGTVYRGGSQASGSGPGSAMIHETRVDAGYALFHNRFLTSVFYLGQNVYLTRMETQIDL